MHSLAISRGDEDVATPFLFSNEGGGWEFPVFWSVLLAAQAMLGDGEFAIGNPFRRRA